MATKNLIGRVFAVLAIALALLLIGSQAVQAQEIVDLGSLTVDGTHPWPSSNPYAAAQVTAECAGLSTRNERLDCATKIYFEEERSSGKLAGVQALLASMGVLYDQLEIADPFQPDTDALKDGSSRIWGVLVKATNVHVSGPSCLVTDVPERIVSYGWVYNEPANAQRPAVGHYGEAVSTSEMVERAIHLDCSDWPEIRLAASQSGFDLGAGSTTVRLPVATQPALDPDMPTKADLQSINERLDAQDAQIAEQGRRVNSLIDEFQLFLSCLRKPDSPQCVTE